MGGTDITVILALLEHRTSGAPNPERTVTTRAASRPLCGARKSRHTVTAIGDALLGGGAAGALLQRRVRRSDLSVNSTSR